MKRKVIFLATAITLVALTLLTYKYFFQKNQLFKNLVQIHRKKDQKTVLVFVQQNLSEYFTYAKLEYPSISLEEARVLSPFRIYTSSIDEVQSSKTDYELLSKLKGTTESGEWYYIPIQWSESEGSLAVVTKINDEYKFRKLILGTYFAKIREGLGNAKLDWNSPFYFTNLYSKELPMGIDAIFFRKGIKLQVIPIGFINYEPKPIPALKIGDLLKT